MGSCGRAWRRWVGSAKAACKTADRAPAAPCYQWTRKIKGKTVSVALSREQYQWLREAIPNWRTVPQTLRDMQRLSRHVLFGTVPHPPRRKRLAKKTLGLI